MLSKYNDSLYISSLFIEILVDKSMIKTYSNLFYLYFVNFFSVIKRVQC